ncbi:MAG: hypothetical protein AB1756_03815 [Acidobacteriota bacterium]
MSVFVFISLVFPDPILSFYKNKITYQKFEWHYYSSPHFDVYYYPEEEEFLQEMVGYAESAYLQLSKNLDHEINFKIPLIYYKTHAEFEQTNVMMQEIPEAVGAFAEPFQNRVVIPIDTPRDRMFKVLTHEIVHIFEFSIFYEGNLGRAIRSQPPLWLFEGLASYLAQDEDNMDRMIIRDAVVNNIIPEIEKLNVLSFLTYRFGHAIFDFMEKSFGKEGVRTFLYEYKKVLLTNNIQKAIKESFGLEMDEFNRRFQKYLRQKYFPILLEKNEPGEYGKEIGFKKPQVFTFSPTISPSGELVAALANPKEELDVVVISANDGSLVRNLTRGFTNNYEYITTEAFSGKKDLSWSPKGDLVSFFVRKENYRPLLVYDALTGEKVHNLKLEVDMGASPSFSPEGNRILFSGNRNGVWDIFQIDLDTKETKNITDDEYYDSNPSYSSDGRKILYNRRVGENEKIFLLDMDDPTRKTQLTIGPGNDIQPSFSRNGKLVFFSSDRTANGIFNVYSLNLDTGEMQRHTDLLGGAFTPVQIADQEGKEALTFAALFRGTFRLYRMEIKEPVEIIQQEEKPSTTIEEEMFKPPLSLSLDEEKKSRYRRLKWDVEAPEITVGVANDGSILSNADVIFTDLLGDHRIRARFYSIRDFSNLDVLYLNLKHRFDYAFRVFDFHDFFVLSDYTGLYRVESRVSAAHGIIQWPFNRYYRVEGFGGVIYRSQIYPTRDPMTDEVNLNKFSETFPIVGFSFNGDTTRFKEFGAYHGKRFEVSATYAPAMGDARSFKEYSIDFRSYAHITSRSLFAWRLAGIVSDGDGANVYGVGGLNQIRGYDFREFFGTRIAFTNFEFRFPLIDELKFPFGAIRSIRGVVFADIGTAWFKDGWIYDHETFMYRKFDFYDSEEKRLVDGHASYGLGFNFFFLGPLQFNWMFSKRTDIKSSESGFRTDFYIAYEF